MQDAIRKITSESKEYPSLLKEMTRPPKIIYMKGNLKISNQKAIAIVGSRNATEEGKKIAKQLAYECAESGLHIISGLALRDRYASTLGCVRF